MEKMILDHAAACYPAESCGLIIGTPAGRHYMPCVNIADSPTEFFEISPTDWLRAHTAGEVVAVVHSHPDGLPVLSEGDRAAQRRTALEWWLVCDGAIKRFRNVPPLLGRQFEHGVTDCYTLFRDAYHLAGVDMPEFARTDEWWARGENLYIDNMERTGFRRVDTPEPGDIILICLGTSTANHAAIYCGEQMILHHCPNRFSRRDLYNGFWLNYTHSIWRHELWQLSGFTAILNDMAASST
ncbi:C40 family peptidase [Leminorella grimontii]|uniref:C40 family peptidase n=1 Tax=Leminorella grimontii TaxID=82981 RepID=UPI0021C2A974|nr:C40 family peptidase [Leminorella grimontii]